MHIGLDDPLKPDVAGLLEAHGRFTAEHSPPGTCHRLDAHGLARPEITFWTARDETGAVLGCIALKALGEGRGEIKSMHVAADRRGKGVARALVQAVIDEARGRGYTWLGLETGRSDGFAPSRALYARMGFEPCPPFGDYLPDTFSYCMSRTL